MKVRSLGRLGIAVAGLVCLFAVFSASAFGAGKPEFLPNYYAHGAGFGNGIDLGYDANTVNPNGAATTVTTEYREGPASEWKPSDVKAIGSGTSFVRVEATVFPIVQRRKYEVRATATNSYGTAVTTESYGPEQFGVKWAVKEGVNGTTSSYRSDGTFKIEWEPLGGWHERMECSEEGTGEFGAKATSESLSLTISGCAVYIGNEFICTTPMKGSLHLKLGNVFQTSESWSLPICAGEESSKISFPDPLQGKTDEHYEEWETVRPVTVTGQGKFNTHSATVTITSNWQLTGGNVGKSFKLAEA